jgi:hypothetical protein
LAERVGPLRVLSRDRPVVGSIIVGKMNPQEALELLEAVRSGEYEDAGLEVKLIKAVIVGIKLMPSFLYPWFFIILFWRQILYLSFAKNHLPL